MALNSAVYFSAFFLFNFYCFSKFTMFLLIIFRQFIWLFLIISFIFKSDSQYYWHSSLLQLILRHIGMYTSRSLKYLVSFYWIWNLKHHFYTLFVLRVRDYVKFCWSCGIFSRKRLRRWFMLHPRGHWVRSIINWSQFILKRLTLSG